MFEKYKQRLQESNANKATKQLVDIFNNAHLTGNVYDEVKSLLDSGGKLPTDNLKGIIRACHSSNNGLLDLLLEHGLNINQQDNEGTLLAHAVSFYSEAYSTRITIINQLLKRHADTSIATNGEKPFQIAMSKHNPKLVFKILEHTKKITDEFVPIINFVTNNYIFKEGVKKSRDGKWFDVVELALKKEANPNIELTRDTDFGFFHETALTKAIKNKDKDLINLLLEYNASPNLNNAKQVAYEHGIDLDYMLIEREQQELDKVAQNIDQNYTPDTL